MNILYEAIINYIELQFHFNRDINKMYQQINEQKNQNNNVQSLQCEISTSNRNEETNNMTPLLSASNIKSYETVQPNFYDPLRSYYKSLKGIAYIRYKIKNLEFYLCLNCSQYMKTFNAICNHINKHRNVTPYKCHLCLHQYTTRSVLNRHLKLKHGNIKPKEINNQCPICSENYTDKKLFYNHLLTEILSDPLHTSTSPTTESKVLAVDKPQNHLRF